MGQYLVIGIASAIGVSKERAKSDFKGVENFKAVDLPLISTTTATILKATH